MKDIPKNYILSSSDKKTKAIPVLEVSFEKRSWCSCRAKKWLKDRNLKYSEEEDDGLYLCYKQFPKRRNVSYVGTHPEGCRTIILHVPEPDEN